MPDIPSPPLIRFAIAASDSVPSTPSPASSLTSSGTSFGAGLFRFLCDDPPATDPLALALYLSCLGGGAIALQIGVIGMEVQEMITSRIMAHVPVDAVVEISGNAGYRFENAG